MDNADAFDCQGTWAGGVREASLQVVPRQVRGVPRPAGLPARHDGTGNVRLCRGRRGSGGKRRRGAYRRGRTPLRRADRGGARRPLGLAEDTPRDRNRPDRRARGAALLDRGRAQSRVAPDLLAAWAGPGRNVHDQRHALGTGGPGRIRPLGGPGVQGLGLRQRSAPLQADGSLHARPRHAAGPDRQDQHRGVLAARSVVVGVLRGLHGSRHRRQRRLQRRPLRRRRLSSAQHAARVPPRRARGVSPLPRKESQPRDPAARRRSSPS